MTIFIEILQHNQYFRPLFFCTFILHYALIYIFLKMLIFLLGYINCHNSQSSASYTLDHNKFSDLTNIEYRELNNLIVKSSTEYNSIVEKSRKKYVDIETSTEMRNLMEFSKKLELPSYKNWIDDGAVTPVQDQKSCGNCWAFSAVGAIEGAMSVKYEQLTPLSEQMLVDCSIDGGSCKSDL